MTEPTDSGLSELSAEKRLRVVMREIAGLTKTELLQRAEADRERYHPENPADYRSSIGVIDNDGSMHCVGCWWCCHESPGDHRARYVLAQLGEDY